MPINTEWATAVQSPLHSSTFNKKQGKVCSSFEDGCWLQTFWTQCIAICSLMIIASFIIRLYMLPINSKLWKIHVFTVNNLRKPKCQCNSYVKLNVIGKL